MIELIIIAVSAFVLGFKVSEFIHVVTFKNILKDLNVSERDLRRIAEAKGLKFPEEAPTEPEPGIRETIHIKIEQHQGQIYAFRVDTDQFLGQGTDRDSLVNGLAQRFKGVRMIIDEGADLIKKPDSA